MSEIKNYYYYYLYISNIYIYQIYIYQIKQTLMLSYVLLYFFFKIPHECGGHWP